MYAYDLHTHTGFSFDSRTDVLKLIQRARRMGLRGIAVTDHETAAGAMHARKINPYRDFEVIVGQEVKTEVGDVIGLFIRHGLNETSFQQLCAEIRQQGGVTVLPHPFKKKSSVDINVAKAVDCIEVFNSRITAEENRSALELCRALEKPLTVGSDAHTLSEIGRATLLAAGPRLDRQAVLGGNDFSGRYSPRYVHYVSALIGNYAKGTLRQLILKKSLPDGLCARFGW